MLARPVPSVNVAPLMVTTLPVPAFLSENAPRRPDRLRVSPLTRPLNVPPVMVALVVASYILLAATTPVIASAFGVMLAVAVAEFLMNS
ncbi:hypothetical protein D3C81_806250 [compost metagenome]